MGRSFANQAWGVAVRMADGSLRYWCAAGARRGGQDEWSPRASQARRFDDQASARREADQFTTSNASVEYLVVEL